MSERPMDLSSYDDHIFSKNLWRGVLTLHDVDGDDEDRTQSSSIVEDRSFVFYECSDLEEEEGEDEEGDFQFSFSSPMKQLPSNYEKTVDYWKKKANGWEGRFERSCVLGQDHNRESVIELHLQDTEKENLESLHQKSNYWKKETEGLKEFYLEQVNGQQLQKTPPTLPLRPPPSYSVAIHMYETAKSVWSFGKSEKLPLPMIGNMLTVTEDVLRTLAQTVGVSPNLDEQLKPTLEAVDQSLTPTYKRVANFWTGCFPEQQRKTTTSQKCIALSRPFDDEDEGDDSWIPLDSSKVMAQSSGKFYEKPRINYEQNK